MTCQELEGVRPSGEGSKDERLERGDGPARRRDELVSIASFLHGDTVSHKFTFYIGY
jgi:hypothetical protein